MDLRERPVIFSSPMVREILEGRKTQTRRVIRPVQPRDDGRWPAGRDPVPDCPYGVPGDRLWVRETFRQSDGSMSVHYAADPDEVSGGPWRPSIFMPRWASRLTLEITDVRVQRLQEISEEDAKAEGVSWGPGEQAENVLKWGVEQEARFKFADIWDSINAKRGYGWDTNPWVWALTFRRLDR